MAPNDSFSRPVKEALLLTPESSGIKVRQTAAKSLNLQKKTNGPQNGFHFEPQTFSHDMDTTSAQVSIEKLLDKQISKELNNRLQQKVDKRSILHHNPANLKKPNNFVMDILFRNSNAVASERSKVKTNDKGLFGRIKKEGRIPKPVNAVAFDSYKQGILDGIEKKKVAVPNLDEVDLNEVYTIKHNKKNESKTDTVKVVFVRHGESTWNKCGKFTGWIDVPLSDGGRQESRDAGKQLKELGYTFDVAYTSMLDRAVETADLILEEMGLDQHTEIKQHWKINERHYGALQGLDKAETAEIHGKEQVALWRQSYDNPPPAIEFEHEMHPQFDDLYKDQSLEEYKDMPRGESLKMVRERVTPYWNDVILPTLENVEGGKSVLFVAHEHVLRGMVQTLSGMDNESIMTLRLPNAAPFVFEFDKKDIESLQSLKNYYIQDESVSVSY